MEENMRPVDVISVCTAEGELRPLRLRVADESQELFRVDIEDVVSTKEIPYVGVEATIYWCRVTFRGRRFLLELKYSFRSHTWYLLRKMQGW